MTGPTNTNRLQLPPHLLLILAAPVAVFILLDFVMKSLGDPTLVLPVGQIDAGARLAELTGRYKLLSAFAFFGAVSIAVLVIFALDLWSNYAGRTAIYCGIAIVICAMVGVVYSVFEPAALGAFEIRDLVGRGFFETALGQGTTGLCAAQADSCARDDALIVLETISNPINTLTSFALAAAMIGLILALARRPLAEPEDERRAIALEVDQLTAGRAVGQRYLYCAGLLLTTGVAFLIAWMRWPADMIQDEMMKAQYLGLTSALSLYVGVGYSVLILSTYFPVILILARRAENLRVLLAQRTLDSPAERDGVAPVVIPEVQYLDALKSVAAVLSPVIASAIGSFGQGTVFA